MSGILPDTTVTSATTRHCLTALNGVNSPAEKCNCDSYVAWINSQLGESSHGKNQHPTLVHYQRPQAFQSVPVRDLNRDLRNGVVLARLAEKLSGERLDRVHPHPVTRQQMLTNVDEVLKFAMRWGIKMHPVLSTEIVDGDTRSTLRLVLALAAHFRPASVVRQFGGNVSVLQSQQQYYGPKTSPAGQKSHCYLNDATCAPVTPSPPTTPSRSVGSCLFSSLFQQSQQITSAKLLKFKAVRSPRTAVANSQNIFAPPVEFARCTLNRSPTGPYDNETDEWRDDSQFSSPFSQEAQAGSNGATSTCSLDSSSKQAVIDEQDFTSLQSEIANAKKTLLLLQQMLFEQDDDSGVVENSTAVNANCNKQQDENTSNSHNNNGSHVCGHAQHDNSAVLQLRAQICELNLMMEELAVEKRELECRLVDRDRQLADMQASLSERDGLIGHLQDKVHSLISEGRREVAELKELAVAATSPLCDPCSVSPASANFPAWKKPLFKVDHLPESGDTTEESCVVKGAGSKPSGCRIYYFNSDGAGPFCLFASKTLELLSLRDVRHIFSRFGRKYCFLFVPVQELERQRAAKSPGNGNEKYISRLSLPVDSSMATLELTNDNEPVPGLDNQVYCKIEEVL